MINNYLQELQKEFCAAQEGAKGKIKANIKVPGSRSDLKGQEMDKKKPEGLVTVLQTRSWYVRRVLNTGGELSCFHQGNKLS